MGNYNWKLFSLESSNEFIKLNNIKNKKELKVKFVGLFSKCKKNGWLDLLEFSEKKINWSNINSVEDVTNLIALKKIKKRVDLKKNYPGLYSKCLRLGWIKDLTFTLDKKDYSKINTIEDAQEFILKNDIKSYTDRAERFPGFSSRCDKNNWNSSLTYTKPRMQQSWKDINTIEKAQIFINDLNISRLDFSQKFSGLSDKFYKLGWMKSLKFSNNYKKSSWETKIINYINKNYGEKLDLSSKKTYSNYSELDIYISKYKIAIEVQGPTHLFNIYGDNSYIYSRKSDIKKNRWCRDNGITLLYFTYSKDYEKYGYPYYIYTSEKELLNDIKNIIKNNKGDGR